MILKIFRRRTQRDMNQVHKSLPFYLPKPSVPVAAVSAHTPS